MALFDKSLLKPENSIIVSLTVAGFVAGAYYSTVGPVSDVHAMPANDVTINRSLQKAGWIAAALVGAATIFSKDLNPVILGGGAIIVMELAYRHAHQTSNMDGAAVTPVTDYTPAAQLYAVPQAAASGGYVEATVG